MNNTRIAKLQAFLLETPNDCFLNHALALEYVKEGDTAAAKQCFEKNMATDPTYVATYYHFGKLLENLQETRAAIIIYEQGMFMAKQCNDQHSYSELLSVYEELVY